MESHILFYLKHFIIKCINHSTAIIRFGFFITIICILPIFKIMKKLLFISGFLFTSFVSGYSQITIPPEYGGINNSDGFIKNEGQLVNTV